MNITYIILAGIMIFNCLGCSPDSHLIFEKIEGKAKEELGSKPNYLYNSTEEYVACFNETFPNKKPVHVIVYSMDEGEKVFEYKFDQGNVFWEAESKYILVMKLVPGIVSGDEDLSRFTTRYNVSTGEFIK